MARSLILLLTLLALPLPSLAWWQDDWSYRKEIRLDTSATGANLSEDLQSFPVLIRLHTGNFQYFLDLMAKGEDIRFVADDDITPLKFHIERFDPINEMALIWVQVPSLPAASNTRKIWMYYGNPASAAGGDAAGTFGVDQALVYHFTEGQDVPRDATAYGQNPSRFTGTISGDALVAGGARFEGGSILEVPDSATLAIDPAAGWTWSAWVNLDQPQENALLFRKASGESALELSVDGQALYASISDPAAGQVETARNGTLNPGTWHHVALVVKADRMSVYLDGAEISYVDTAMPALAGPIQIGADPDGARGFLGQLDEVRVSRTARSDAWLQAIVNSQGPLPSLVAYGEDGAKEGSGGEPSYFAITLRNVTLDGWVVIVILAIMAAISWVVMISKGMVIGRIRKDNQSFQEKFAELGTTEVDNLDHEDTQDERTLRASPLLMALSGRHEHFESSTLYRIYHAGVQEMHHRMPKAVGAQAAAPLELSPQAIDAIRATMDGVLTRENQRLNSQMVLLTIAISGGPFLGLLGTVVGVMITFAAIAASGDVNVNAIAPGIAAALVATVAGLAVAIPALFGYNYLGSRIKEVSADMHVFVDEFVAKIAEQHS